ncbi:hypothetical protein FSP39_015029 [Pinctada imbricata]|uniref:G-protein coupled receptors family 1 profile domain-containing protein n=1 Tax=Pinctada imbricata TaxID=66713 RepID=A0AA88XZC2_PINIB|nr:hypothetical protein FSP39_015029 [Pinctada imbricata]
MRSVTTIFLAGLACSDTLSAFLWSAVHFYFYGLKQDYTAPVRYPLCIFHDFSLYLAVLFHATSVWLTTTLGIQRCVIVVFPFKGPRLWTIRKSVFITIMAYLVSTLFFMPLFFMKTYSSHEILEGNSSITVCVSGMEPWFQQNNRLYDYTMAHYSFRAIFVQLLPCLSMFITTAVLAYKLRTEKILQRCKSANTDGQKSDVQHRQRTTLMIIIIMIIFLIVEIPTGIVFGIKLYEDLSEGTVIPENVDYPIAILQNFILLLSYHCNFWIYVGLSSRFRKTLKQILCGIRLKKRRAKDYLLGSSGSPYSSLTRHTAIRLHVVNGKNPNGQLYTPVD